MVRNMYYVVSKFYRRVETFAEACEEARVGRELGRHTEIFKGKPDPTIFGEMQDLTLLKEDDAPTGSS